MSLTAPWLSSALGVNTATSGSGVRTTNVSILKNISLPIGKTIQRVKESFSDLVTMPKEEQFDSDDEIELPKNNQPLVLSGE